MIVARPFHMHSLDSGLTRVTTLFSKHVNIVIISPVLALDSASSRMSPLGWSCSTFNCWAQFDLRMPMTHLHFQKCSRPELLQALSQRNLYKRCLATVSISGRLRHVRLAGDFLLASQQPCHRALHLVFPHIQCTILSATLVFQVFISLS